jgi:hypothetical protein
MKKRRKLSSNRKVEHHPGIINESFSVISKDNEIVNRRKTCISVIEIASIIISMVLNVQGGKKLSYEEGTMFSDPAGTIVFCQGGNFLRRLDRNIYVYTSAESRGTSFR